MHKRCSKCKLLMCHITKYDDYERHGWYCVLCEKWEEFDYEPN